MPPLIVLICLCRVAAEWILRCGGGVKFKKPNVWMWDYNALPPGPKGHYLLEAINAKETSVTTGGLLHLGKQTWFLWWHEFHIHMIWACQVLIDSENFTCTQIPCCPWQQERICSSCICQIKIHFPLYPRFLTIISWISWPNKYLETWRELFLFNAHCLRIHFQRRFHLLWVWSVTRVAGSEKNHLQSYNPKLLFRFYFPLWTNIPSWFLVAYGTLKPPVKTSSKLCTAQGQTKVIGTSLAFNTGIQAIKPEGC